MESVLKTSPDSTNSDLLCMTHEVQDNDSSSAGRSNTSVSTSPTLSKSAPFRDPYLPEDDGSILTPEHAFVQYQTRSEDQACQICGQPAVGFHHRAYVCEACKKFFMRHTAARYRQAEAGGVNSANTVCPMGGQCRVEGPGRGKCPHCRYRKCLDLGMTLTPPGGESGCDISQIPCRVCGGPSSGFHFGALTCEGCKGFFRRTVLSNVRLECLSNNDCPITPANRNMCKSCRFQRCLAVGMSKTGSRIGRQPNAIKYYCAREISQISGNTFPFEYDAAQPSSSSMSTNGGRARPVNNGTPARQRNTSRSSDGDKPQSWLSIQPAQSSTDHPDGPNGRLRTVLSPKHVPSNPGIDLGPSSSSPSSRRSSDAGKPTENLPQSYHQKKRRHSDLFSGGLKISDSPATGAYPAVDAESDRLSYGSSPSLTGVPVVQQLNQRISRTSCGSYNQQVIEATFVDHPRRSYDFPATDPSTHSQLTLEYSLPDPDTSSHISPTTEPYSMNPEIPGNGSGKLHPQLPPVHLNCDDPAFRLVAVRNPGAESQSPSLPYVYSDPKSLTNVPHGTSYRSSHIGEDVSRVASHLPSSNLVTTKPLNLNDPSQLNAHATRRFVDQITSTVLHLRTQHDRTRSLASANETVRESPSPVNSAGGSKPSTPAGPSMQPPQSASLSHLTLNQYSSASPRSNVISTIALTMPLASNHSTVYATSSPCKSTSPDVSWKSQRHHSPSPDVYFRFPSSSRFEDSSPVNGAAAITANELAHVVDVTSTSSASWFAAAAAAAAVANVIMVASHGAPSSQPSVLDEYPTDALVKGTGQRPAYQLDYSLTPDGESHTISGSTKRHKMTIAPDSTYARPSPSSFVTDSDLESIYALKLAKCDAPESIFPGAGSSFLRSPSSSSGSDLVTVRAAAAAAAAAAATAAGLVLSNSRVRPDDLVRLRQPGNLFGNAASPTFARSLAAVTSAMDLALYANRTHDQALDALTSARTAAASTSVEQSINVSTANGGRRSHNGSRTAFISLQEFMDGIRSATKYMMSERKKIRNNLPQPCPPMHTMEHVEDVWERMMQHFELHSRFIVYFVKLIPGFNQLEMSDKRQLVRSAMYPLMLLELSRDYLNAEESRYNYFDFTEGEREVILKHFPTFHTITGHLIRSGEFFDQICLDDVELTLVCAQEVFKNHQGLVDPASTEHLYHLAGRALIEHIVSSGKSLEDRSELLRHVSPLLEHLNLEHHQVIAQLRQDKPQLNFPELYIEMFQLSEEEQEEADRERAEGSPIG